jgi:gluconolactonase
MKFLLSIWLAALMGLGTAAVAQQTSHPAFDSGSLVKGPLTPKLIARQFSFTEGASCDRKGNVFFTDQPNNKIWEYTIDGKLLLFLDSAGRSNGMYFDARGNLLTCADEKDELWSISPDKKITVLITQFKGHRLNGPNDLWIAPGGLIYFTDPYYQRPYWDRSHSELDSQMVFTFMPGKEREPQILLHHFKQPNGIVGTPDGKFLYVSDIGDGKTWRYGINLDGSVTPYRKLAADQGSDGMTLDEKGNVYLTGDGVTVYDSTGRKIAHIPVPEKWTANLCFGGKHKDMLFITASEGLYVLPMRVHGVE